MYSDVYEKSRKLRGVEGANHGQFLPKGKFSDESKWWSIQTKKHLYFSISSTLIF